MSEPQTITVRVPLTIRRRGGRKQIITPDGASGWVSPRARTDNTMIKAISRGFRWRKLLETGVYGTREEIAAAEKINPSYVSRLLRTTLLAPDIVEAILDGRQPDGMTLPGLMEPFSVEWGRQGDRSQQKTSFTAPPPPPAAQLAVHGGLSPRSGRL